GFNAYLAYDLAQVNVPGVTITQVDVHGLFQRAAQPNNPYGFTNWTDAVGPFDPVTGFLTGINTNVDASHYLFFDSVHPTTTTHQIIGLQAAGQVYSALAISNLVVTNAADVVNPQDGGLSLREMVNLANT